MPRGEHLRGVCFAAYSLGWIFDDLVVLLMPQVLPVLLVLLAGLRATAVVLVLPSASYQRIQTSLPSDVLVGYV